MKVSPLLEGVTVAAMVFSPLLQPEPSLLLRVVGFSCGAAYCLVERSSAAKQKEETQAKRQADIVRSQEIESLIAKRSVELESLNKQIGTACSKAQAFKQSEESAEQRLEELKEIEFNLEGTLREKRHQLESLGEQIEGLSELEHRQKNLEVQERTQRDRIEYLASQIKEKHDQLSGLNDLVGEELDALVLEKKLMVDNLEKQISDLGELAEEQFEELEAAEAASKEDAENYRLSMIEKIDAYHAETTEELRAIAESDKKKLDQKAAELEELLEADKLDFLEKYEEKEKELRSQIEYLSNQLGGAYQLLEEYRLPEVPRGCEPEAAAARELMLFFRKKGISCINKGSFVRQDGRIVVNLEPIDGGEASFRRPWLLEFQMRERLTEPIQIETVPGAVQFLLKPDIPTPSPSLPPSSPSPSPPPPPSLPSDDGEITRRELDNFQEPDFKVPPYGEISRLERTWAVWLWERQGIRNQSIILGKIWRSRRGNPVSRGDGASFLLAKDKLHKILEERGIKVKPRRSPT